MREDWIETYLPNVCDILDNLREPINSAERTKRIEGKKESELYPYYGATGQVGFIDDYLTDGNYVLIGEDAAPFLDFTKDVAYKISGKTWVNNHAHILKSYFNDDFLLHYLNQFQYRDFVTGTTRLKLTQGALRRIPVRLAPLPEQRAIVLKIENLFASLDKGIADLKTAQEQLKVYRQAVLKKAFEGDFTKEWRAKNPYSQKDFLNELKKEKSEAIKSKLIAKDDYFPEFSDKDLVYKMPDNWICLPWKTLTSNNKYAMKRGPFGSALKKEFFVDNGYVVYEQGHAINDEPYRHRYFVTPEKYEEMKSFSVKGGDMIISCSGVTLGRICLLPNDADAGIINQALLKIDMDEKIMLKNYFVMLFRSETFQRLIFGKSLGTAMPNMVGMPELKQIPIPVPSINEQKQIIKEIETRLSVCDKVEQSISEALEKAEALRQSILKKAFEGKLLSKAEIDKCKQDADYEPAAKLLERIKGIKIEDSQKETPLIKTKKTVQIKVSTDIQAGVIAKVIKLHEDNPEYLGKLSHVKCEKISHLVEYHLQIALGRTPVKDAAGPDDFPHLQKVEHRAKMAGYFFTKDLGIGHTYVSGRNITNAINKLEEQLPTEKNAQLNKLIKIFLKLDLEQTEVVATVYAGWNNLLIDGKNPTDDEIVYESRENWSKRKLTIERGKFYKTLNWMRKKEIALIPLGNGMRVDKSVKGE